MMQDYKLEKLDKFISEIKLSQEKIWSDQKTVNEQRSLQMNEIRDKLIEVKAKQDSFLEEIRSTRDRR
jgi:hypothetical protein